MVAARYDITIEQGSKFESTIIYKDSNGNIVDLTGYTAEMQIRETVASATTLITLSTSNGRITITGASGQIDLSINATDTDDLDFERGVYDLEITPASGADNTIRILQGKVALSKEVTRA